MKDFLGVEVQIGDDVVTMVKNYRCLVRGRIVSVADKSVVVEYAKDCGSSKARLETYRVVSNMFIKLVA